MSTSQNGFRANDRSLIASYSIPGGKVALRRGDVATVLVYFAKRYHSEVEPLKWPGNWGYAERKIRGSSTTLSNHASGTALDLNAPAHPLGKRGTFSSRQVRAINRILADCDGVLRHGKNYNGRKDEMHVEINASAAKVKALASKIKAGKKPGPSGGATASSGGSSWRTVKTGDLLRRGTKGTPVKELQTALGVKADGYFGSNTEKAVKAYQKSKGLTVDGVVGPKTLAALKGKKAPAKKAPSKKSTAPAFPLPKGHWFGRPMRTSKNHSGFYSLQDRKHIVKIQKKLKVRADGLYGDTTAKAVRAFQKKSKLKVDSVVGSKTWKKLFS
ncbi:peptidoglycan-binding protein [Brevibacterium casei]|uniref:peptidoglycan-binding protein n=1 Tax=Brevibacterium casei TaxID=33889 RepID=UPI003F7DCEE0